MLAGRKRIRKEQAKPLDIYDTISTVLSPTKRDLAVATLTVGGTLAVLKFGPNFIKDIVDYFALGSAPVQPQKQLTNDFPSGENKENKLQFTLGQKLGEGGNGTVYRASMKNRNSSKDVAVKIFNPFSPAIAEIINHCKLEHPKIVKMYAHVANVAEFDTYLVMELMDGSLEDLLKAETRLTIHEVLQLSLDIAEGIEYLHGKNIIHQDLKPANVLLYNDNGKRAKLSDFGTAKYLRPETEADPQGTIAYWSPELFASKEHSKPADIYAFGCTLYQMLTREHLARENRTEMINKLQGQFKELLLACCAEDPSDRPVIEDVITQLKDIRDQQHN